MKPTAVGAFLSVGLISGCAGFDASLPDTAKASRFFMGNQSTFNAIADLLEARPTSKKLYCVGTEAWELDISDTHQKMTGRASEELTAICSELGGVQAWRVDQRQFIFGGSIEQNGRRYLVGYSRGAQTIKPECKSQMAQSSTGECFIPLYGNWSVVFTWTQ